ncbi:alpha/beta fold hydrolase [Nocardia spumae]|uniref:alpha/beta fold hydrolase n=1 Tax=Nocardia spumae TaxID=2887190 RepID=UPI001D13CDBB|nr:alpha/beta hydrolase [Nocardia spumae]
MTRLPSWIGGACRGGNVALDIGALDVRHRFGNTVAIMVSRRAAYDYIDAESRFTTVAGANIHYQRAGSGPPVLLLHGSGSSLHQFDEVAALMSSSFDVIRLDLPGFGLTGPRADRDYRIGTYTQTVAGFLDRLDVVSTSIVGNSLGGNIAWNFALDYPRRVQRLVLVNATGYPGKSLPLGLRLARNPVTRPLVRRLVTRSATERNLRSAVGPAAASIVDEAMVDRVHAMLTREGNQQAFIDFANTEQADRTGDIRRIAVPTLVLRSADMDAQYFARDIAGSREAVYLGGGHLLPEEAPNWVANEVSHFLATQPRTEAADTEDRS